jgi:hypothetical protein
LLSNDGTKIEDGQASDFVGKADFALLRGPKVLVTTDLSASVVNEIDLTTCEKIADVQIPINSSKKYK